MTEDEIVKALLDLEHFEGRTAYLYRDSGKDTAGNLVGNATIGIGCLVPSEDAACELLFQTATGAPATEGQIRGEYRRVMAMPPARLARTYRQSNAGAAIELSDHAVTELATTRLRRSLAGLHALVPGFDDLPAGPRAGLLDLAWCLGLAKLASWHHLLAAVARRDWPTSAFESHVHGGRDDRNAWRASQFKLGV
jgi:hypothetical protein